MFENQVIKNIIKDKYGSLVTMYSLEHFMFAFCQYIGVTDQKELKTLQEQWKIKKNIPEVTKNESAEIVKSLPNNNKNSDKLS